MYGAMLAFDGCELLREALNKHEKFFNWFDHMDEYVLSHYGGMIVYNDINPLDWLSVPAKQTKKEEKSQGITEKLIDKGKEMSKEIMEPLKGSPVKKIIENASAMFAPNEEKIIDPDAEPDNDLDEKSREAIGLTAAKVTDMAKTMVWKAKRKTEKGMEDVKEETNELIEKGKSKANEIKDKAKEKLSETANEAKNKLQEAGSKVGETVHEAQDKAKQTANEISEIVSEKATDLITKAKETADEALHKVEEGVSTAATKTKEKFSQFADVVQEEAHNFYDNVERKSEKISKDADEVLEKAKQKANEFKENIEREKKKSKSEIVETNKKGKNYYYVNDKEKILVISDKPHTRDDKESNDLKGLSIVTVSYISLLSALAYVTAASTFKMPKD